MTYELFQEDAEAAERHFEVISSVVSETGEAAVVEAQADTGSRYQVVVVRLPALAGEVLGGRWLISVIQPWQNTWTVSHRPTELAVPYLVEHLGNPHRAYDRHHGGDVRAVQLAVGVAARMLGAAVSS